MIIFQNCIFGGFFRCLELLKWRKRLDSRSLQHRMLMWACLHECYCQRQRCFPVWSFSLYAPFVFQIEEAVVPFLSAFAQFREDVRTISREQKGLSTKREPVTLCWNNFQISLTKIELNEDKQIMKCFCVRILCKCYDDWSLAKFHHVKTFKRHMKGYIWELLNL